MGTKEVELFKEYYRESDGLIIVPLSRNDGGDYWCKTYEIDDDGNEVNVREYWMTKHDILRK